MQSAIFSPSSMALDRAILFATPSTLLAIDSACLTKSGAVLGVEIAQRLGAAAKESEPVRRLMDGGLLFHLKMECITRQQYSTGGVAQ